MRRVLLFLLFCALRLALSPPAAPSLPGGSSPRPRGLPATAPPVRRPTGRKEGRMREDIWAAAISLPENCGDAARGTARTVRTGYGRMAVWPGN